MTLKELYNARRDEIPDIVGNYLQKSAKYRSKYSFEDYLEELDLCPTCGNIIERDDMTYHKWDTGGIEELICESCRESESV